MAAILTVFVGVVPYLGVGMSTASAVRAEPLTISAFGDSLTAGFGLPDGQGFVPQLQAWLTANGADALVLNAGVSGDTTAGGLARIDWALTPDVDAVILELGANDMLRGLPAQMARDNLDAILGRISARDLPVLIAGIPAPPNYGPEYQAVFDGMYPALAEKYDALHHENFLGAIAAEEITDAIKLMQPDGLHPNRDGVARIVADIGPMVLQLIERAGK